MSSYTQQMEVRVLGSPASCSQHMCSGTCAPKWDCMLETHYTHVYTCPCACCLKIWIRNPVGEGCISVSECMQVWGQVFLQECVHRYMRNGGGQEEGDTL